MICLGSFGYPGTKTCLNDWVCIGLDLRALESLNLEMRCKAMAPKKRPAGDSKAKAKPASKKGPKAKAKAAALAPEVEEREEEEEEEEEEEAEPALTPKPKPKGKAPATRKSVKSAA